MLSLELAVTLFIRPLALVADSPKHCIVTREQARNGGVPPYCAVCASPPPFSSGTVWHSRWSECSAGLVQLARLFANLETIATIHAVLLRRAPRASPVPALACGPQSAAAL